MILALYSLSIFSPAALPFLDYPYATPSVADRKSAFNRPCSIRPILFPSPATFLPTLTPAHDTTTFSHSVSEPCLSSLASIRLCHTQDLRALARTSSFTLEAPDPHNRKHYKRHSFPNECDGDLYAFLHKSNTTCVTRAASGARVVVSKSPSSHSLYRRHGEVPPTRILRLISCIRPDIPQYPPLITTPSPSVKIPCHPQDIRLVLSHGITADIMCQAGGSEPPIIQLHF